MKRAVITMVAVSVIGVGAAVTSQFGQASFAAGRLAAARRKWPGLVSSGVGGNQPGVVFGARACGGGQQRMTRGQTDLLLSGQRSAHPS